LKRQVTKAQEGEKRLEKYIEKNRVLKNVRDELKENNEAVTKRFMN
jgi:hypothetical protein